jgi:ActR/RegA family two-component response regulator
MLGTHKQLKIIIMDDDEVWCTTISQMARLMGHNAETAVTLEDAHQKIQNAYNTNNPYHVAVVDLNFEIGKHKVEVPRGKETIRFIKTRHPYMACVVVSGAPFTPDNVLDMRDEYGLDYYLQKDRFDLDTFSRAIEKSLRRVNPVEDLDNQRNNLKEVLDRWKNVRIILLNDLGKAREREALKGIDSDVATQNEIERYTRQIGEVEKTIALLEKEIAGQPV